jgi:hypothetical protein
MKRTAVLVTFGFAKAVSIEARKIGTLVRSTDTEF